MRLTLTMALAAALTLGCSSSEPETIDPNNTGTAAAGKADCPNCDPNGPSAFEQAEIGARWYSPGDKWTVAFQFLNRGEMSHEDFLLPTKNDQWVQSGVFLFQYEALRALEPSPETGDRAGIEISVEQADPDAAGFGSLGYEMALTAALEQLDS